MKTFIVSDTHFGHQGVCNFLRQDGTPLRPWESAEEMDSEMISNWNEVVGVNDKVYHLGDFCINRKSLYIQNLLHGKKILIKGNHDIFKLKDYKGFEDIRAYHVLDNILLSHIPVHPGSKGRFKANMHGHTHANKVLDHNGHEDPWYIPMSVEHWDYTPVNFEEVRIK